MTCIWILLIDPSMGSVCNSGFTVQIRTCRNAFVYSRTKTILSKKKINTHIMFESCKFKKSK